MKKRRKRKIINILFVEITILILLLIYIGVKNKYENIFCKNTFINGQDCSSLTVDEAINVIQTNTEQYTLKVIFKGSEVEYISAKEIELTIDDLKEELSSIKERQRKDLFLKGGIYNIDNFSYNEEKLYELLSRQKQLQTEYMQEKTEVRYIFNFDSKLFEITKQNVYYLDINKVFEEVSEAIEQKENSISLEKLYEMPESDSKVLAINKLNQLISSKVTYQLPGGKEYVLDAATLYTWLVQDEDGNYIKDDDIWNKNLEDFVTNVLSNMANTVGIYREFKPTEKATTVFVDSKNYGYQVNVKAEIEQLKANLEQCLIIKREPCYAKVEVSTENNGLGNSYVEIDITRQKVWVYVDGKLEIETDCVTGCMNEGHSTPTGIFTLTDKEEDRILRGKILPNGQREYESHVNYWMPFNGAIGLHDATWRNLFGGDIYINNGSHGCINLPFEAAKKLYNVINKNMPIIVYES